MAGVKFVVIYPRPTDIDAFEKVYQEEHVPMAVEKLEGKTRFVATKVVGSPQGTPPFYRIAEIHFPSMEALERCAASEGAKETLGHAAKISTGGPPIFLVAEEESTTF
ncbi:MAG TPA: EthD family reductase [Blastocatellia bacterium]|nr:EthD family reductase [Blastocatellia bacterium]